MNLVLAAPAALECGGSSAALNTHFNSQRYVEWVRGQYVVDKGGGGTAALQGGWRRKNQRK